VLAPRRTAARLERALEAAGFDVVAAPGARGAGEPPPAVVVLVSRETSAALAELVTRTHADLPDARIVLVCTSATVREMRTLVGDGVDGIVLAAETDESLPAAVRAVASGLLVFPRSLRANLARPVLSSREKQVLGLVVLGLTNGEIATRLHVSESTVKSHLATSYTKLGARSRREAAALILDPEAGLGTGILAIAGNE
jgi:DNA-binding NarL/FixJ family response regulator